MIYKEKSFCDSPYTDLACERRRADIRVAGVEYRKEENICGIWERIHISSDEGAISIGRPMGFYDTLTLPRMDLMDFEEIMGAKEELAGELCEMVERCDVTPASVLIVGLGNGELTPDAVGPRTADKVHPTMHIYKLDEGLFDTLGCSKISVLKPGVTAKSGLDSSLIVKGVCDLVKPDLVIAIDSLRARDRGRLGSTIQISSTGIVAGSGLRGARSEISEAILGSPIISIGVPTVIDSRALTCGEQKTASYHGGDGLMVSPKEIGEIVENAAEIIGGAINLAFGICG